jgi:hypothetical protein
MNHSKPPHAPAGVRGAAHCFFLLLLATLVTEGSEGRTRPRAAGSPRDALEQSLYLPAIGAAPLRFAAEPPAPDLSLRQSPAAGPKHPDPTVADFTPAEPPATEAGAGETEETAATPVHADARPSDATPVKSAPSPILRDDLRPHVRPDDFLPFFQVPGSSASRGDVIFTVPVPTTPGSSAPLPASSATYTQTPK